MTNSSEERLKIAVFIDFDNIAIGVKQSLNRNFDVGTVLEAIKEKGQVISKIAYGDWKRAEDFSRAMTQHAVQMVQRNLTPGGDKNGADIALALDALEMAFTRNHINAFVIVGGDSDFIALVEKLKQYDKTVFIVGGRAFTSVILQKNCHEFIAYENLIGTQSGTRKSVGRSQAASPASLENALPLIRRALKVLSDREVSPQLGLLKSTLLQLDSTFSERDYGVSSFRDFIQKVADAGFVNLKQVDRSLLVELKETKEEEEESPKESPEPPPEPQPVQETAPAESQQQPVSQPGEAIRALQNLLREPKTVPHWPMYLRTFKQFIRSIQPSFDERQFGLASTYDLVRLAGKEGILRVERNRQGILRIYPAEKFPQPELVAQASEEPIAVEEQVIPETAAEPENVEVDVAETPELAAEVPQPESEAEQPVEVTEVVEAQPETQAASESVSEPEPEAEVIEKKPKAKRTRKTAATKAKPKKTTGTATKAKTTRRKTKTAKTATDFAEEIPF